MRISGIILPSHKRIVISLTYICGIGHTTAHKICEALKINIDTKTNEITDAQASEIEEYISKNYVTESALRSMVNNNKKMLMQIGCFRGNKFKKALNKNKGN